MNTAPNKLINEKSPYLLQHAYNPVNWYPWGEEAFEKAKEENKPIFLSIGYSTCHWCHVMEKESFEDEEVARILNENFISIKVDREERPDIDSIYMEVCQGLTGRGGWPLSIFLTPDKKPFYAGTYFPKNSYGNLIGFIELLNVIKEKWLENKEELIDSAERITNIIRDNLELTYQDELDESIIDNCFIKLEKSFDPIYGGFGNQPKFPTPHNLLFLLRYGVYKKEQRAFDMVEKTLLQMYKGGIFDHIGYGFSRYSVDRKWLVPHFEKMLYDNALLTIVYTEAYQLTQKKIYKEIAEKIITFVLNELTSDDGAFFTAIDADSEGVEGKFYTWSYTELEKLLSKEEFAYVIQRFHTTFQGNFEGKNILNSIHLDDEEIETIDPKMFEQIRNKLYQERKKRITPHTDDKILTANNAMMIVALSLAGKVFNNASYIEAAEKAYEFINQNLINDDNIIFARFRDGEIKYIGYLEDYAYLIWALIELFLATGKLIYIKRAEDLNEKMIDLFKDYEKGGFYHTTYNSEKLIMKTKPVYDGAIPSGNSVLTYNLLRLSEIIDDIGLTNLAREQFTYFSTKIKQIPDAYTYMLSAYLYYKAPKRKIVLVSKEDNQALKNICGYLNQKYLPFTTNVKLFRNEICKIKFLKEYCNFNEEIAAYICENFQCNDPLFNEKEIINEIKKMTD